MSTLIVIAKTPVPGRVKTRLTPPFTAREAALLAAASLADTLQAARQTDVGHRILALDGEPRPSWQDSFIAQKFISVAKRSEGWAKDFRGGRERNCVVTAARWRGARNIKY